MSGILIWETETAPLAWCETIKATTDSLGVGEMGRMRTASSCSYCDMMLQSKMHFSPVLTRTYAFNSIKTLWRRLSASLTIYLCFFTLCLSLRCMFRVVKARVDFNFTRQCSAEVYWCLAWEWWWWMFIYSRPEHIIKFQYSFFPSSLSHWLLFCFHSPCYCRLEVRKTNSHSRKAAQQHGELIQWRRSLLMSRECTAHRNVHLMTQLMRLSFFCNNKQNRARELKSSLECVYDTRLNHVGNNS